MLCSFSDRLARVCDVVSDTTTCTVCKGNTACYRHSTVFRMINFNNAKHCDIQFQWESNGRTLTSILEKEKRKITGTQREQT